MNNHIQQLNNWEREPCRERINLQPSRGMPGARDNESDSDCISGSDCEVIAHKTTAMPNGMFASVAFEENDGKVNASVAQDLVGIKPGHYGWTMGAAADIKGAKVRGGASGWKMDAMTPYGLQ